MIASFAKLGNAFFHLPVIGRLYRYCLHSPRRWARLFGLAFLFLTFSARTARQWGDRRLMILTVLAVTACEAALLTAPLALLACAVVAATTLVLAAATLRADETGHRCGAEGYGGRQCENTVEALEALLQREASEGPLPHFPYIEFDVQETKDGELVVFHDSLLSRAFPAGSGSVNAAPTARLVQQTGIPFQLLTVQDLTLAQLQTLHLGGRSGLRVPTLQQILDACIAGRARRTLAIEVKLLRTDAARQRFIDAISGYLASCSPRLNQDVAARRQRCSQLGWAGVIAFPHLFSAAFGEYGSPEWRRWAAEFKRCGIPACACHCLWLTLIG